MALCHYRFNRGSRSVQHPPSGFPSFTQAGMQEDAGGGQELPAAVTGLTLGKPRLQF